MTTHGFEPPTQAAGAGPNDAADRAAFEALVDQARARPVDEGVGPSPFG